ncbi:uncharacterized protein MONOS_10285 [Monocercomonoides exilis]|uniref:uncharacterized protein n=1 Tax=Monocercomonoides exilis TaxID=2049356 RepID=UPI0035597C2F|nr:hypothetical protein MONOS_10285 [Monocercomonoides exilis]|eukprot:MONOS_10285.1-p1 / transcript=MONOS_10285.1 / gene=MONOS_10285 / organism=Monocercomonoides_exilis_PA203 / gene_product=unspecified product / transcript_product=unspecified product / location=Mono_scaffold00461:1751-2029(-) / protein_length=93 / sequence_SO=supercontig / SO=protein_coding / is_pseudo=false
MFFSSTSRSGKWSKEEGQGSAFGGGGGEMEGCGEAGGSEAAAELDSAAEVCVAAIVAAGGGVLREAWVCAAGSVIAAQKRGKMKEERQQMSF